MYHKILLTVITKDKNITSILRIYGKLIDDSDLDSLFDMGLKIMKEKYHLDETARIIDSKYYGNKEIDILTIDDI